jgi:hypothetical protein
MPTDIFAITAKQTSVQLDAKTRTGSLVFSVANTLDRAVKTRASAKMEGDAKATFKVHPDTTTLNPRETQDFKVEITVDIAVLAETAAGSYGVKLVVVDDDKPDDFSSTGPVAKFGVTTEMVKPFPPRWLWIVIAAAVALGLATAGYFIIRPDPTLRALHDQCDAGPACGAGLKCSPLSGESLECRRDPKEKCQNNSECSSYWCRDGACSLDDGSCTGPQDCRSNFTCTASKVCGQNNGEPCSQSQLCASGFCGQGICTPPPKGAGSDRGAIPEGAGSGRSATCTPPCTPLFTCDPSTLRCVRKFIHFGINEIKMKINTIPSR